MIESIHIQNVGPLKDVKIDEIKPFTLLIGPSANGKSTLMKVLALFRWLFKMQNIRSYLHNSKVSRANFKISMPNLLKANGLEGYFMSDSYVVYQVAYDNGDEYVIEYKNGKLLKMKDIPNYHLAFWKLSYVSEQRNNMFSYVAKPERGRTSTMGFYMQQTFEDFLEATENIKTVKLDHVGMQMEVKKQKGQTRLYLTDGGSLSAFELKNASSGIQTSAPLTTIVDYFSQNYSFKEAFQRSVVDYLYQSDNLSKFKPTIELTDMPRHVFLHVEEPELSLHPAAQRMLINHIVKRTFANDIRYYGMGIMLATHSPYILNQLNLLFQAYDKNSDSVGAQLDYDKTAVYLLSSGIAQDLKVQNARLVNTDILSQDIDEIYDTVDAINNGNES